MAILVKSVGIILIIIAVIGFLMPAMMSNVINYMKVGNRCYFAAAGRVILGILLLAAIPKVAGPWFVGIIGGITLLTGVVGFVIGLPRMHSLLDWFAMLPDSKKRIHIVIAGAIGALLIYSA